MRSHLLRVLLFVALGLGIVCPLGATSEGFQAGAARIDITPPMSQGVRMSGYAGRTDPADGIHDKLYVRAIVLDDGNARAALVMGDVTSISSEFWEYMAARIQKETGIRQDHLLLAATHTHAAPSLSGIDPESTEGQAAYTRDVTDKLVQAVQQAIERLRPAVLGAGTGVADVGQNRIARLEGGSYWLGKNPAGPSDKTVHVLAFATPEGEPIAAMVNYGVHCTSLSAQNTRISGDLAGACSRYLERESDGDYVALWSSGAGGDQNPLYNQQTNTKLVNAMGEILALEARRVMEDLRMVPHLRIQAVQSVVTCPGRRLKGERGHNPTGVYEFEDADPVDIRLSLLMLNHIAVAGVSGEVLTMIGQHLKDASPFNQTIMITHCNGSSGYLADDAAFSILSYETVSSRVKPGYAEKAIVDGFLEMMDTL
jgi:hypothetical protein